MTRETFTKYAPAALILIIILMTALMILSFIFPKRECYLEDGEEVCLVYTVEEYLNYLKNI